MNKKQKNIEQLFSESFEDFRLEPSSGLWKSISSKLAWKNFFTFNPTAFNAYYLTGILALSMAGALWITKPVSDDNQVINEITVNNTIEKPVITPVPKTQGKTRQPETRNQKPATSDQKPATSNQKPESGINDTKPVTTVKYAPPSHFTWQARNTKLVTPNLEPITPNSKLETRTLKPVTSTPVKYAPPSHFTGQAQQPVTSNQSPDLWPNMDSLFTNQTPTPPQHTIQFPNAFTPNPNGPTNGYYTPGIRNNDVFHPVYKGVVEYHLRIFNRRGELIFESNEIQTGWDGYINDRLASQGVYIWKARGKYSNGENFVKFGNVMLIIK